MAERLPYRSLALLFVAALFGAGVFWAPHSNAAPIVVPCAGPEGGASGLAAALTTAGSTPGDVTIALVSGCTYVLGGTALTLPVAGNNITQIDGDNATLKGGTLEVQAGASLELDDVNFVGDGAELEDGAIINYGGLRITSSTFTNIDGGAIWSLGSLKVTESEFSGNSAGDGGAIFVDGGDATVTGSTFRRNRSDAGGAVLVEDGALTIADSTFVQNEAEEDGGAIFVDGGDAAVTGSTFRRNIASFVGGGVLVAEGAMTIADSTFAQNEAEDDGGAIAVLEDGTIEVTNSTLSGNEAGDGGAIYNDGQATLTNLTLWGNIAATGAAAVSSDRWGPGADGATTMTNSIVGGSTATDDQCLGDLSEIHDNLSQTGSCGTRREHLRVGPLTDNGGLTETHALLTGSPAIDAAPGPGCPDEDQRGLPRMGGSQNPCDYGAYEANRISVDGPSKAEGDSGVTTFAFTVSLDVPAVGVTEVRYASDDCRAPPGASRLTFEPDVSVQKIACSVDADTTFEPDEHLSVALTDAVNGALLDKRARATVLNDDRNEAPVADGHAADVTQGGSIEVDLSSLVSDVETSNADLGYALGGVVPSLGTAALSGSVVTYTASPSSFGNDSFDYVVTDGGNPDGCGAPDDTCAERRSATGTVTIAVAGARYVPPDPDPDPEPDPEPEPFPFVTTSPSPTPSPTASASPTSSPVAPGPDLILSDVSVEVVPGDESSGEAALSVYAAGPNGPPIALQKAADAPESVRVRAVVANVGTEDAAPTTLEVTAPGWTGATAPVPGLLAGDETEVETTLTIPDELTDDTSKFNVEIGRVEGETNFSNNANPSVSLPAELTAASGGTSTTRKVVIVTLAVVALGVAIGAATVFGPGAASMQARRPRLRRSHGNNPAGGWHGKGLAELADHYLGAEAGPGLWSSGAVSAQLREALEDDELASPYIATVFWRALIATPRFQHALRAAGASDAAHAHPEILVVPHAGGTRHDLVVLDPASTLSEPSTAYIEIASSEIAEGWEHVVSSSDLRKALHVAGTRFPAKRLTEVLHEVAAYTKFALAVVPKPEVVLTNSPSPAWPVGVEGDEPTSSAGVAVVDGNGRRGVTVAEHAVRGHSTVLVNGVRGTVVSSDPISDSSFVEVDVETSDVTRGEKGPLSGMSPRVMEVVEFDGLRSGKTTTTVTGWDPTILTVESYIQNKIVTEPVTMPGDSGAALIDGDGHVLGFAFYTTGMNARPQHSAWIWAESVYRAHGLRPPREDELAASPAQVGHTN